MFGLPLSLRLALTIALMVALLALSIIPGQTKEGDSMFVWAVAATPTPVQKLAHLVLYALLAYLWAWTLEAIPSLPARLAASLALTAGFGAAMEFAQTHIPGRFGNLTDVALNAAGAVIGLVIASHVMVRQTASGAPR